MTIYSSKRFSAFYDDNVHLPEQIPDDAVEITHEHWRALLEGQVNGKVIDFDSGDIPQLIDPPVDTSPERYTRDIATRRYQAEISGITTNGMALPTDRDSQALVNGAALAAVVDPAYRCQWKTLDGFIDLQAPQILEMAAAVRLHVQTCFDREAELLDHLEKGTFTEDMLDHGWPA
ncbi:DUF4376 domain-containing protein [Pseudomonas sp. ZM23]|uniref:DUF4376 domain-containing protein n=1 Tax=Pseudomonas triclosanedens TaxID=2961893 RepID=A0ABY6ZZN0_9PSED|nr:DUF4376 domain-containing protein [Pseudomonas triclosanedens]MCP8463090.1 DUF4376 domain-containing protein [Pseudomonas triclosanedens]MCP8468710.1 DUF4376 domain-containing protein [Pseudomonas triclosanedens]MCP8475432.1 DUF4376 domain-containing protein [Pseudomonas triclosanedens]WAI50263.1 DUF4376 domain-containing protein [Pseudomonas triclosanedens]